MDNIAKIWETSSGKLFHNLKGHPNWVNLSEFSPNGKYIIRAGSDGFIKLWSVVTGKEIASLLQIDSTDWAVITPEGYFDALPAAMDKMYYVAGLHTIELGQLKEKFYVPGLLSKLLSNDNEKVEFRTTLDKLSLFPSVDNMKIDENKNILKFTLTNQGGGFGPVFIWIDGKNITDDARYYEMAKVIINGKQMEKYPFRYFDTLMADYVEFEVELPERFLTPGDTNIISVAVYNAEKEVISRKESIAYVAPKTILSDEYASRGFGAFKTNKKNKSYSDNYTPNLFGIFIGVSDYTGSVIDLPYASEDAESMDKTITTGAKNLFIPFKGNVKDYVLTSDSSFMQPTKDNILAVFDSVAREALPTDILFVFLSGHGDNIDDDFHYLTKEAYNFADLQYEDSRKKVSISGKELINLINKIPAKKVVLILDACATGKILDYTNLLSQKSILAGSITRSLDRMKDRTGTFIITSSTGDRPSYSYKGFSQGILTHSILDAMSKGDCLREGSLIDIQLLFSKAKDNVEKFVNENAKDIEQIAQISAPYNAESFDIGALSNEDKAKIPLGRNIPIIIRPQFWNTDLDEDNLLIAYKLSNILKEINYDGKTSKISFIDEDLRPNSYKITGKYTSKDSIIKLDVKIKFNNQQISEFEIIEPENNIDKLINKILVGLDKAIDDNDQ